jgi:hypothetical protein
MTREQLAHVLRAAATIADDPQILVIGSQAILGSFWEDELPEQAWMSIEADVAFLDDPDERKANAVDGAIGELSPFHQTYAYYAQGVSVSTAVLPDGWRDRVVAFAPSAADPAVAACLDRHDLVVSKLVAMRVKDLAFAAVLLQAGLVDKEILLERAQLLNTAAPLLRHEVLRWIAAQP